ncbi:MAG: ATP phosphoribosyltransferase [Clostridiales bacterium]
MENITIALSKGRLAKESVRFFESIGINCEELKGTSRKLILEDKENNIKFFLSKPSDVPTYVEYGAADIGIVGKDTLLEEARNLYEVLDLGFAKCSMCLAGPKEFEGKFDRFNNKRVATKYPRIATEYFEHKWHESIEVIKLNGSVELAPLVGLSEVIVDLVESGRTLKDNGLVILDTIAHISARMIINKVSLKMKSNRINKIIEGFKKELG